jgi:4-hydroxy-3-methylbut-2-en-1-yl diphosphate reductase
VKSFEVPEFYRSELITAIKNKRKQQDKLKKDFTPTVLDYGAVQILLARHFGFCYGVENAIEIAFKTVAENPGKRIFLLSEMIHNPQVNADLQKSGVSFIMDTQGNMLTPWDSITSEDIVIVPAFGTTLETEALLQSKGIDPQRYNTTCPFVERVWKRGAQIADEKYTLVIHGKPEHEETKATFSHSASKAPSIVIKDIKEAKILAQYIKGEKSTEEFAIQFVGRFSKGFDAAKDLQRIGVINQTTMLAEDTKEIADYLKAELITHFSLEENTIENHFADTRDTLCYATNDNQSAVKGMLEVDADLAIVVGGYNSSNTSHLVELCEEKLPTYFIRDVENIISETEIVRYHFRTHEEEVVQNYLPAKTPLRILVTSGASCPDAVVERVIGKILAFNNLEILDANAVKEYMD